MSSITIRQKYDGLKAFILPGVYNLTDDEVVLAKKACDQLIKAIPKATLDEDQEDDRRVFLNQIKIIRRQLQEIQTPTFTSQVMGVANMSLYWIALEYFGDALRWIDIAKINGLTEPHLTEDTVLNLPVR